MIIYATTMDFAPPATIPSLAESIALWLRKKIHVAVEVEDLICTDTRRHGQHALELVCNRDGDAIESWAMRYTHPDDKVSGRRWSTEVGMIGEGGLIRVSVLLFTSEISSRVPAALDASRPWFVIEMLENCAPASATPGLFPHRIALARFPELRRRIEQRDRRHPIIIVSATQEGAYLVDADFLASQVATLADVYVLPAHVDHLESSRLLGQFYNTWGGAVKVIWPYHRDVAELLPANTRWFTAADLADMRQAGEKPERRILQTITHGTNALHMRRHTSPEHVRERVLRRELEAYGKSAIESEFLQNYIGTLEASEKNTRRQIEDRDARIESLIEEQSELETTLFKEREDRRYIQAQLDQAQLSRNRRVENKDTLVTLRAALAKAWGGGMALTDVLEIIGRLFPDRVVVLESAWKSARDAEQFQQTDEVLKLLWKLATDYWEALNNGQGDNDARVIFGTSYAAKESNTVRNTPRLMQYRTFNYQSQLIEMQSHLKLGVKDSIAQTWRAHFSWDAAGRVIVLGHCGKHLPLS